MCLHAIREVINLKIILKVKCVFVHGFRLKEFAKLYDVIKNERNKCVNLIQTSTQKAAEMREKIKIFQNEIEILRTAVAQKER